jgi:2-desacetyl-2-hydroxyethyl bacteriochlorophyllide A dehydrogenase
LKAVTLIEPGRFGSTDLVEARDPAPGEALIAVRRVGVCGTDLHAFHGRQPFFHYPRILGHELGVEVLDVGAGVTDVRPGDRCALRPYLECGRCDTCRRGFPNCCPDLAVIGAHIDGGMRERQVVPADHLHASRTLSFDELALAETLSIGGHAVVRGAPTPLDRVLILGAGPIGLGLTAVLDAMGVKPVVCDISPERRVFAADWAKVLVIEPTEDMIKSTRHAFGGESPTVVFDATGSTASMTTSFSLLAHGGRLVFVGLVQGDITFHDPELHRREVTLAASRNATASDFQRSLTMLESGSVDVGAWLTDRCSLADVPRAFPRWARDETSTIKAIVDV